MSAFLFNFNYFIKQLHKSVSVFSLGLMDLLLRSSGKFIVLRLKTKVYEFQITFLIKEVEFYSLCLPIWYFTPRPKLLELLRILISDHFVYEPFQ